ncbi:Hypothetical predicted protein [Pelobates cultripes]|uniref:Uncharacterized protein n=1 Tax=Pelobates cultripes TaxID=61616 RepID=A0AAD1RHR0_PELCU|nr:Hypothetical predicted protein [Pelobates cultripes]
MGRKTKKPRPDKPQQVPNIAKLLRQIHGAPEPKMATYPETYSELLNGFSSGKKQLTYLRCKYQRRSPRELMFHR